MAKARLSHVVTTSLALCLSALSLPGLSVSCPAGSYSPDGNTCALCSPGSYSSEPGSTACTPAPAGHYVATEGATNPVSCMLGYTSNPGATECRIALLPLDSVYKGAGLEEKTDSR